METPLPGLGRAHGGKEPADLVLPAHVSSFDQFLFIYTCFLTLKFTQFKLRCKIITIHMLHGESCFSLIQFSIYLISNRSLQIYIHTYMYQFINIYTYTSRLRIQCLTFQGSLLYLYILIYTFEQLSFLDIYFKITCYYALVHFYTCPHT